MLTAWGPAGQSARFCGEDVQYPQQAQRNAQRLGNLLFPHQPHPLSGGVANRLCNSALVPPGWRAFLLYGMRCVLSNPAVLRSSIYTPGPFSLLYAALLPEPATATNFPLP